MQQYQQYHHAHLGQRTKREHATSQLWLTQAGKEVCLVLDSIWSQLQLHQPVSIARPSLQCCIVAGSNTIKLHRMLGAQVVVERSKLHSVQPIQGVECIQAAHSVQSCWNDWHAWSDGWHAADRKVHADHNILISPLPPPSPPTPTPTESRSCKVMIQLSQGSNGMWQSSVGGLKRPHLELHNISGLGVRPALISDTACDTTCCQYWSVSGTTCRVTPASPQTCRRHKNCMGSLLSNYNPVLLTI